MDWTERERYERIIAEQQSIITWQARKIRRMKKPSLHKRAWRKFRGG